MADLNCAGELAEQCNELGVWSLLAKAQLDAQRLKDSITSYIKANDALTCKEVVAAAKFEGD